MGKFAFFGGQDGVANYPFAQTIDPSRTETAFNYNLWTGTTEVYLLQTPALVTDDYSHVMQFDSLAHRDEWAKKGKRIDIQPNTRPLDKLRVSLPFDTIVNNGYNYIAAYGKKYPVPDAEPPQAYFYFIQNMEDIAPNTTELHITLDIWQTYGYKNKLASVRLDRGHESMCHYSVNQYLANPINRLNGLNCQDVNFGDLGRLATQFNELALPNRDNDRKWYVCVGATGTPYPPKKPISITDQSLGEINPYHTPKISNNKKDITNPQDYPYYGYDSITYNPERASRDIQKDPATDKWVDTETAPSEYKAGSKWLKNTDGWNKYLTNTWGQAVDNLPAGDFRAAREAFAAMPATVNQNVTAGKSNTDGTIGLYWFAIPLLDHEGKKGWNDFLFRTRLTNPNFYKTIKSCFLCPDWLIDDNVWKSKDITFPKDRGYEEIKIECWLVNNVTKLTESDFDKTAFGFDTRYDWMTKLYTSPYSAVQYVEPSGNKTTIPIQKFTKAKFALKYMLNCNAVNPSITCAVPYIGGDDALGQFMFTYNLPQGMININKYYDYLAASQWTRWRDRQAAEIAYENALQLNEMANKNAHTASANDKTNADKTAESVATQTTNNLDAAFLSTKNQYDGEGGKGIMDKMLLAQIPMWQVGKDAEYAALVNNLWTTVNTAVTGYTKLTEIENINMVQTTTSRTIGAVSDFFGGALSLVAQAMSGNAPGAVMTGVSTPINAAKAAVDIITSNMATSSILTKNEEMAKGLLTQQCQIAGISYDAYLGDVIVPKKPNKATSLLETFEKKCTALYGTTETINEDTIKSGFYGKTLEVQKGDLMYKNNLYNDKGQLNRDNARKTMLDIAKNNQTTANSIADLTKATGDIVAKRTRDFAQTDAISATSFQKAFEGNITYGAPADNSLLHEETESAKINIITQDTASLTRTAEFFDRWGYASDGEFVDMSNGYQYMEKYTYWKCIDVIPDKLYGTQAQKQQFLDIFKRGVTIHHVATNEPILDMGLFTQKPIKYIGG